MSINAATSSSSQVSATTSASQVNSASNSDNAKKSSADSSFKEEMDKVSVAENKKDDKGIEKNEQKVEVVTEKNEDKSQPEHDKKDFDKTLEGNADYSKFASMAMMDVNSMLQNDIQQMASRETTVTTPIEQLSSSSFQDKQTNPVIGQVSMTQSDAEFFVNLTQTNDVSVQNITAQAQNLVNQGAEVKEVKQNMQISETLLNAINTAKENNQPLRIDFDQNVSVILRVNKDGVISANFIPGDKVVEQYLRNNIDSLKATFNENDLPYTDLSYSNRGKQQQKENRRNKQ